MTQVLVSPPLASFPDRLQNDYFESLHGSDTWQ